MQFYNKKKEEEVGDDLSVRFLYILSDVSTLPDLVP